MEETITNIELLIEQGRYIDARSLTQAALEQNANLRIKQLHALALSKSGMPSLAREFLEKIYSEHPDDAETAGILGGIYKALFRQTEDSEYAIQSRDTYLKNFTLTGSYYTGINAATMSAIAGQARKGREIAKEVIDKIGETGEFWEVATLGEAYLLSKDYQKSVDFYLKARQQAGTDWGKISSVSDQLWLIKHYMHVPSDILKVFNPPTVMAFVGHMIDHPDRPSPRFPSIIQGQVKEAIRAAIKSQKGAIGYSSLACGSDILFAEAMEEEGGELNIYIPFEKQDFLKESVAFAGDEWVNRFERLISKHHINYITHEPYENHADLFSMQSKVVLGSTLFRSELMHSDPYLISVLSEFDLSRMQGGTRDNISLWPFPQRTINISTNNFHSRNESQSGQATPNITTQPFSARPALYTLVVDVENQTEEANSKLNEIAHVKFQEAVVAPLASIVAENKIVIGFTGLRPLYDYIHLLRKAKGVIPAQLRLSIGGGPIHVDDFHEKDTVQYKKMSGTHVQLALDAHEYSIAGECVSLSPIAFELALYKVKIALMSRVNLKSGETVELFKVNWQ